MSKNSNDHDKMQGKQLTNRDIRPNYNSEGNELDEEPEPSTTEPVRAPNDTQMADFTYRSVDDALGFDTRRQLTTE